MGRGLFSHVRIFRGGEGALEPEVSVTLAERVVITPSTRQLTRTWVCGWALPPTGRL